MRSIFRKTAKCLATVVVVVLVGAFVLRFAVLRRPPTPDVELERADKAAWLNDWASAEPLYRQAENLFIAKHQLSKALYARVSQVPPHMETGNLSNLIWTLTQELALPEAQDDQTRLRILMIRGMIEVNYDAATARSTWSWVERLAKSQHQYLLASRAMGEQGIAAFILGDIGAAKKQVITAWTVAKYAGDKAAQVRYASVYGAGLVQFRKFQEGLGPLDEAIKLALQTPGMAYPAIAVTAKVEALSGLNRQTEALQLAGDALQRAQAHHLEGHLYQVLATRGGIYEHLGRNHEAVADYIQAQKYARNLSYWRGLTEVGGVLARQYEKQGHLHKALATIDESIDANKRIPNELYFVPRNLAIKAEIAARMGQLKASNELYEKSADLIDSFLTTVPTPNVERNLLAQLSEVYSGYFASLCNQDRFPEAFRVIEKARGRIEAQSLQHHKTEIPHKATEAEARLTKLNVDLLDADQPKKRSQIVNAIYETEQQLDINSVAGPTGTNPVPLAKLQRALDPSELILEYVLDEAQSYVLAITAQSVHQYALHGRVSIEELSSRYRSVLRKQQTDPKLAQALFDELLAPVPEYRLYSSVVIVPDGDLHLIPFSALMDGGQYILNSHTLSTSPSGTVLSLLRDQEIPDNLQLPYMGVAAWTTIVRSKNPVMRALSGPERSELIPLPESKREVEAIAIDLPKPSTVLLGSEANETRFKRMPLDRYNVIHLALHGYADVEYPDRSSLIFASQTDKTDDGLLQVREIRRLHLNATLVTLSACNTGVGPVGQSGISNLVNAFIQAGAKSVISTLWETEDHATTKLMTDFYKRLAQHQDKAEALRQAKLDLLNSGLPPYYWATFELVGEPHGSLKSSNANQARASIEEDTH